MTTLDAVRRADPAALAGAGAGWRRLAGVLSNQATELDRRLVALGTGWTGDAATAATGRIGGLRDELDGAAPSLAGIAGALADHAGVVARAQLLAIDWPAAAVALAGQSDTVTAGVLRSHRPPGPSPAVPSEAIPPRAVLSAAELPATGTDPATVAAWWRGLSEDERDRLTTERPDAIGNLDGIPAEARDAANRAWLAALVTDPRTAHLAALCDLRTRLDASAYLLALAPDGRGQAVVAFGDPDTADHVVTYVPGLGGGLDGEAGELSRAEGLAAAAGRAAPGARTSVIAWLGYHAPASLPEAASLADARGAAAGLHRFQAGLRATHLGPASHNTVVGLSYGSTVVGVTGHGPGLLADDVVLVGSPGTGVAHAADLGLDPAHVWASTAKHDAINAAAAPSSLLRPDLNPLLRPLFGEHTEHLWYGPSPAGHAFGAHVFTSAPGSPLDPIRAHVAYFDTGNPALADMADIAVGDYAEVR